MRSPTRDLAFAFGLIAASAMPALASGRNPEQQPTTSNNKAGEVFATVDYQQGDYGTGAQVETVSTTLGVAVRKGRVRIAASAPYLRTTAPVDVVVSQGGLFGTPLLASSGSRTERISREGLGDATLQATYDVPLAGLSASIGAGLKVPTASRRKGLGTGKLDYAVNAQIVRPIGKRISPFAAVGYTIVGQPQGFAVRNTLSASGGARVALSSRANAALSYSFEQSASTSLPNRQSLGLGVGVSAGRRLNLGLQTEAGVSKGAPAVKLGVRIGAGF
ncbi:transporter [Sphingomonas psychrolutea]|uniref:transporter n=1 Tax=Sphingomonas psychrolutea TaxID=1259676 RepID=UPI00166527E0|nr:transporter [Sphingomonas psychrolutea]